ncbi:zinc-binding dehydrogenase [Herbiconiux sp. CPCC 205716]|uniref:Zinc-binding dehydrogenase n=1 Tax=Herbiconiux gentiana TaxID=2970912 RepID=A0ABT2GEI5_9MICO|nr:zinc-binding dehydrogenase [Herbiconiux gentiana]MCS5713284.1 zinc-binding dehydrogenase [Herbiconiux gentiana]
MTWPTGEMPVLELTPGRVTPGTAPVPPERPGEVLVEVAFLGICGTDLDLLRRESYFIREGLAAYPLIFGHEFTGTVVAVADGVETVAPGDRVVGQTVVVCGACGPCQAGFRDGCEHRQEVGLVGRQGAAARYVSMPSTSVTRLPQGASLAEAVLIEPGVTAVNAVVTTGIRFDDRVAVLGTGTLGLLTLAVARRITPHVDAIGSSDAGLELALELGAERALRADAVVAGDYTVAIEAAGRASGVGMLGTILRPGGRAALVGVVAGGVPDFDPAPFTMKGLTLHGIFHGLDHYGRMAELIAAPGFPAAQLVDRVVPWHEAEAAFAALTSGERRRPKVLLDLTTMR